MAVEFALVAVDRQRVEAAADDGHRAARIAVGLLRRLSFQLSGAQLGITISSVILGFLAEPTIAELLRPLLEPLLGESGARGVSIALALALATVFQMVVGELIPKNLAIARPESTAYLLAPAMRIYSTIAGPVIRFLDAAANATVRRMGIEPKEELTRIPTLPELGYLFRVSAEEGLLARHAEELLERSIRFSQKTAADILVPRVSVRALPRTATVDELIALAGESGHSRFPVYGTDLDDVEGVVLVKSVHTLAPEQRATTAVHHLMGDVLVVPESRELEDLLRDMRTTRNHLAVVVDEYGGTEGIITLEDLVEEIVGEIDDEYDRPAMTAVSGVGEYLLSGSLHPDEVEDACGLVVPEGPYETLAGFVLDRLGCLPDSPGDTVSHEGWRLTVEEVERRRITRVRVVAPPGVEPVSAPEDSGGASS